jgi:hypothetical protein
LRIGCWESKRQEGYILSLLGFNPSWRLQSSNENICDYKEETGMLGGFLESKVWWIPGASWQSYFLILGFWDFGILGFWESVNSGETVNPEDTPLLTFPRFPRFHATYQSLLYA